jgi:hypothetical protein
MEPEEEAGEAEVELVGVKRELEEEAEEEEETTCGGGREGGGRG